MVMYATGFIPISRLGMLLHGGYGPLMTNKSYLRKNKNMIEYISNNVVVICLGLCLLPFWWMIASLVVEWIYSYVTEDYIEMLSSGVRIFLLFVVLLGAYKLCTIQFNVSNEIFVKVAGYTLAITIFVYGLFFVIRKIKEDHSE